MQERLGTLWEKLPEHIITEWDYEKNAIENPQLPIDKIGPRSGKKVWWRCPKGHSYDAMMRHRVDGSDCPVCANRRLLAGFNDFATVHPEKVDNWLRHPDNPSPEKVVATNSTLQIFWWCEKGHYSQLTPQQISRGVRCSYCHGSKVLQGFNDLASRAPESVKWWDKGKNTAHPSEIRFQSGKKLWWKCPKGHSFSSSASKFYEGRRCPQCAGKTVGEENSVATTHPHLLNEWSSENKVSPNTVSRGYDGKIWWVCEICGNEWENYLYNRTHRDRPQGCPKCAKGAQSSRGEDNIADFLDGNNVGEIIRHHTITQEGRKYEIDIFIPEYNLGIEYNGLYYHSEKFVNKQYHYDKFSACKEAGITLVQIWEDDWLRKKHIVQKMLLHKLGINQDTRVPARKTIVTTVTAQEAIAFLQENHIQGGLKGACHIGLLHNGDLVAVMSVKNRKNRVSIERYATSCVVPGGFTKLLKHIEKTYRCEEIVTFSDNCVSNGDLYSNNGFVATSTIPPDYWYVVKGRREHKFNYRKKRFKNDPDLLWCNESTERELALMNNLYRVYDAGKLKWSKTL